MFSDCEGCYNCTETEDGYFCERYGIEIDRVNQCEEWNEEFERRNET